MRCKNCGKEIEKFEIFCEDCKERMKTTSSREELIELERLIEENKNNEDLELTKELPNIESIESIIEEKANVDVSELYNSENTEEPETREERNQNKINPLSNSTCIVKYTLTNIDGDTLDSSASFTCKPNNMITGFMAALTKMAVNDTVTAVIPYTAGYGVYGFNSILPYSTLVFGIRLDSIVRLM